MEMLKNAGIENALETTMGALFNVQLMNNELMMTYEYDMHSCYIFFSTFNRNSNDIL